MDISTPPAEERIELPGPSFGAQGQWVLTNSYGQLDWTNYESGASSFLAVAAPSIRYFVLENLSVGAGVGASFSRVSSFDAKKQTLITRETHYIVHGVLAHNVPMGRHLSFYPELNVGWQSISQDEHAVSPPNGVQPASDLRGLTIEVFAPLLIHPQANFFFGFGPDFVRVFDSPKDRATGNALGGPHTDLGAGVMVGGTFGGARTPLRDDRSDETAGRARVRFGDTGVLALDASSSIGGTYTWYDGGTWSGTVDIEPSLDVFVRDHFSVGGLLILSTQRYKGVNTLDGTTGDSTSTTLGGGVRVGYEVPIAPWVSWYPRAGFTYSHSESTADHRPHFAISRGTFVASAPFLFHIVPHVFVGAGPYVDVDAIAKIDSTSGASNPATSVGATILIGGWFRAYRAERRVAPPRDPPDPPTSPDPAPELDPVSTPEGVP
jgi:hypothetical protein